MTKEEALSLIDAHKNRLVNPVDLLHWTWLRVIVLQIPEADWETYVDSATVILSQ